MDLSKLDPRQEAAVRVACKRLLRREGEQYDPEAGTWELLAKANRHRDQHEIVREAVESVEAERDKARRRRRVRQHEASMD